MNYEILKGNPKDYEDIIDFGNYVFGIDFPTILPKLYKGHEETSVYHHIVKEAGKIKAMVGSFPLDLMVGGSHLKGKGIGTVSVHRYSRGSGYMKLLMDRAMAETEEEGCDFAVLSGMRQRYEYWGFTPCGLSMNLEFNSANIKHCNITVEDNYKFVEYNADADKRTTERTTERTAEHTSKHTDKLQTNNADKHTTNDTAQDLPKAIHLHNSQPVHAVRPEESFIDIAKSWNSRIYFVYKNDEFAGYISAADNYEKIREMVLVDQEDIDKVLISFMKNFNIQDTNVVMHFQKAKEFMKLSRFCETYSINSSANIYVINYKKVIEAFMKLKNTCQPLQEGALVLDIKEKGRYKIEVKDGSIRVDETEADYDISLAHLDASALLFSHSSFVNAAYNYSHPMVKSWFPLPLFYPELDNV
ncbi:GNAT family N-acetyltransferase [Clostridium thermarum]|uniref:GNAT family N-acetyltransferase n=1 Tax=Clostridium thermarum TaxID=1716543 RepID=UPI00111D8D56|nr:GNAT family N-acetyltransferase [Clostridium thermarum]